MVLNVALELLAVALLLISVVAVMHPEVSLAHRATAALTGSLSVFALVFRKARP